MNVMTAIGLIGAAAAGAERRRHLEERGLRHEAEQNLADARTQVVNALEALNGPPPPAQPVVSPEYLERIAVSVGNRVSVLAVNDIDWIEARSYYARLHIGPRHYLVRQSMNVLESRLNPR
jgi:DNA-binding LytR/AlgR family response regulator